MKAPSKVTHVVPYYLVYQTTHYCAHFIRILQPAVWTASHWVVLGTDVVAGNIDNMITNSAALCINLNIPKYEVVRHAKHSPIAANLEAFIRLVAD